MVFTTSDKIVTAWMNSIEHRDNVSGIIKTLVLDLPMATTTSTAKHCCRSHSTACPAAANQQLQTPEFLTDRDQPPPRPLNTSMRHKHRER